MRVDPDHAVKLSRAVTPDGQLRVCPRRMRALSACLTLWEHGLAMRAINRAAERAFARKRLTREQRVLLALVAYDENDAVAPDQSDAEAMS